MRLVTTIPYDEVKFVWVNNHYDVHISGLCKMGNTLFYFKTINHQDYFEDDDELMCELYTLCFKDEIKWRLKKFFFEQMVGYHWSYNNKGNRPKFYYRKPQWLYVMLFNLYYAIKKIL